jgi:adhesin transport system membrane fusion protein
MNFFNKIRNFFSHENQQAQKSASFIFSKTLWATILALVAFFYWAFNADIDQITRAQGAVIASSRTQIIQSLDGGTIQEIRVKEGDIVVKNQILVIMDRTKSEAAYFEARSKVAALRATKARLIAEISGGQPKFNSDINDYPQFKKNQLLLLEKRRNAINEELSALNSLLALAKKELRLNKPLAEKGDVSLADLLKLQRQSSDLYAQIINKRNKYLQDVQAELGKTEEDLSSSEQLLAQRKDQFEHSELRAPSDGIVKNIKITTLGGVVKPSEEVMQIVPTDDELLIEAKIKPSDIAFVKQGLYASIKIDAFDYTVYGTLNGKVTYISADTLSEDLKQGEQPYYRIQVKAENKKFSAKPNEVFEIQTGMTATVEIKTGHNTILKYLIKPLIKTTNESFIER